MKDKYLIEILLPLYDEDKKRFPEDLFAKVKEELTKHFGGLTCHSRSPAIGLWKKKGEVEVDQIIVYEVITDQLDRTFWAMYRGTLEHRFHQESIIVRSTLVNVL